MGAGLPLFFCAMTFFKLCGWFIFATSAVSLLSSFGLLLPLLMILGPEGSQGDVAVWLRCKRSGGGGGKATTLGGGKGKHVRV